MRVAIVAGVAIVAVAIYAGDGGALMKSVIRGFGWSIGHEVAHDLARQVLR